MPITFVFQCMRDREPGKQRYQREIQKQKSSLARQDNISYQRCHVNVAQNCEIFLSYFIEC